MYEAEIKTDINIFQKLLKKFLIIFTDFNKDFIDEYVNTYKEYLEIPKRTQASTVKAVIHSLGRI